MVNPAFYMNLRLGCGIKTVDRLQDTFGRASAIVFRQCGHLLLQQRVRTAEFLVPEHESFDTFGEFVVEARSVAPGGKLETSLVLIDDAEPGLLAPMVQGEEKLELHPRAITAAVEWLRKRHAGTAGTDGARLDAPGADAGCAAVAR